MSYVLTTTRDAHGQPFALFRHADNTQKAIEQLAGICAGILADGIVNPSEATFFANWIQQFRSFEPVWPFNDILARVERIFDDGVCDAEECRELQGVMEAICGYSSSSTAEATYATSLPLDSPLPDQISFSEREFVVTGHFAYGTQQVFDVIARHGGRPTDASPSRRTHYLVIGTFASRDWINTNHGRKIEKAVELRQKGTGLQIISEEHWRQFITSL